MEGRKHKNPGISDVEEAEIQRQIAEDSDDWVSTDKELAAARPFAEVFPELAESARRTRGRPRSENPKKQVTLRLDADVVDSFRSAGKGWQRRINSALRKAAGL